MDGTGGAAHQALLIGNFFAGSASLSHFSPLYFFIFFETKAAIWRVEKS